LRLRLRERRRKEVSRPIKQISRGQQAQERNPFNDTSSLSRPLAGLLAALILVFLTRQVRAAGPRQGGSLVPNRTICGGGSVVGPHNTGYTRSDGNSNESCLVACIPTQIYFAEECRNWYIFTQGELSGDNRIRDTPDLGRWRDSTVGASRFWNTPTRAPHPGGHCHAHAKVRYQYRPARSRHAYEHPRTLA